MESIYKSTLDRRNSRLLSAIGDYQTGRCTEEEFFAREMIIYKEYSESMADLYELVSCPQADNDSYYSTTGA